MCERYNPPPRNYQHEALASVDALREAGHAVQLTGTCIDECSVCAALAIDADKEYERIVEALVDSEEGEHEYFISRPRLNALSKLTGYVEVTFTRNLPVVLEVTIELQNRTAIVRALPPLETT